MKKTITFVIAILLCLCIGYLSSLFQTDALIDWYPQLNQSPITPPAIVFPIVWTILYVLMGISLGLILVSNHQKKSIATYLFLIQLYLNFMWSFFFFYMQSPGWGLINILLLDVFLIFYLTTSYKISKTAVWLCIPYLIWLLLATHLNWWIWEFN